MDPSCPAPQATPTPALGCTPGTYCNDFCVSCGSSQIYVYDGSCNCTVPSSTYSQPICNSCGAWCSSSPPCGGGGTGGTPAPTSPPGGGACGSGFLCGTVCCSAGDTCVAPGAGGTCLPPSGGGGGCGFGQVEVSSCVGNSCQPQGCGFFGNCSTDFDCTCGNGVCDAGETAANCVADCTYDVTGKVYVDTNNSGVQNCSGACNNGAGDELNVANASVQRVGPGADPSTTTAANGTYSFLSNSAGSYNITLTLPAGYSMGTAGGNTNPRAVSLGPDASGVNFGIRQSVPACTPGSITLNPPGGSANPGGTVTLSVTSCTNVENPDDSLPPPPFTWNPDTGGNNPPPTVSGQTDTSTSSTTTWTAPACPASQTTYTPRVTVGGPGGSTNYTASITVPTTVTVTANVRRVAAVGTCNSSSGVAYSSGGVGATLNITNGGSVNTNQTTNSGTGDTAFACLPQGNYQLSLQVPSGYTVIGTDVTPAVESPLGSNGVSFATGSNNQVATFCIAPLNPWFQTSVGDVRFLNLSNPVPAGLYASTDANYPGIFYSSDSTANLGFGAASVKNWVINNEYSYNADTENRNGGMSYDFYKSKTKQDGVTVTPISAGTFDQTQITASGVYESPADLTINLYTHVIGRRVVILVNGNVTINASTISIAQNQGIFIVAAKGNITIAKTIGTATLSSTTSNIDGYYTAQGSIILDGDSCPDTVTSDLRLNVGGALVANSLKPFSTSGTGTLQNRRSLCFNNLLYPSLYISARPDFITQLTDFYKTTYTKWQEVSP